MTNKLNRLSEAKLLSFCASQRQVTSLDVWLQSELPRPHLAVAARYLAQADWFPSHLAIKDFSNTFSKEYPQPLTELMAELDFEPSRFRNALSHLS